MVTSCRVSVYISSVLPTSPCFHLPNRLILFFFCSFKQQAFSLLTLNRKHWEFQNCRIFIILSSRSFSDYYSKWRQMCVFRRTRKYYICRFYLISWLNKKIIAVVIMCLAGSILVFIFSISFMKLYRPQ